MEQPYLNWGIGVPNQIIQPYTLPYIIDTPTYYSTGTCMATTGTNTMSFELSEN
jgi:hypothetical protein